MIVIHVYDHLKQRNAKAWPLHVLEHMRQVLSATPCLVQQHIAGCLSWCCQAVRAVGCSAVQGKEANAC